MSSLHVRIPEDLDEALRERAINLGYENVSQFVRGVLRREVERETRCPNGCKNGLVDNVCQRMILGEAQ